MKRKQAREKCSIYVDQSELSTNIRSPKTLSLISHSPATVSEMEGSRVALVALIYILISRVSGAEVEMRVRPGDDVTLYCDRSWKKEFNKVWFRNSSNEHGPPLIISEEGMKNGAFLRYSFVWNPFIKTQDLLVKKVIESDLGLYYCGAHDTKTSKYKAGAVEDVYHLGYRMTRLSFCDTRPPTPSTPPVSDCSVCWKLLVSVCTVCVLLSSTCVYWIYRNRDKVRKEDNQGEIEKKQSGKSGDEVGGDEVCYAALDLPNRQQRRLKKKEKRVESSEFSIYSEVKV